MYIRFVVGGDNQNPRELHGPFTEAEHLHKKGVLYDYEEREVKEIFEWFNNKLPRPPWSSSDWSCDAISWFKDTAQSFVSRMYDIVAILQEHGIQVRVIKTDTLFKVLYEDEYQVIAVDKRF
jgi:hypothetical protein